MSVMVSYPRTMTPPNLTTTGKNTLSSAHLDIHLYMHMYEYVSASGKNYTVVVILILIMIRFVYTFILITMFSSWLSGT